jgi:hypothetical protein
MMAQRKSTFHILQAAAQCSNNPQNEDVFETPYCPSLSLMY